MSPLSLGVLASSYVAPAGSYSDEVMADEPLAYWRLGESSGTSAADSSGNGRTLTLSSATGVGATGLLSGDTDTCWDAPGSQYGTISRATWMTPSAWTAEAMIEPDATSSYRGIVTFDGIQSRGWNFYLLSGKLHIYHHTVAGQTGTTTISADTAHHVALTYDGADARLYLDGTLDGGPWTVSLSPTADSLGLVVGASQAGSAGPPTYLSFDGKLDEVAYYDTALSAARILAHAQAAGVA